MPPIFPPFTHSISSQVVGGEEAEVGSYPFIVSLQIFSQHFCAGSILNEKWIITAGHCINSVPILSILRVKAGKYNLQLIENTEQTVKVVKAYVHENYKRGIGPYDIGLLKLASPLKLNNNVQAIELAPPESEPTGKAWLCGWGSISTTNYPIMPNKLQHVKIEYINRTICHESVKRLTGSSPVHETNVCTGPLYNKISACSGDSGGPLISHNGKKSVLTGIVSWGIFPCGTLGAPSVYTRIIIAYQRTVAPEKKSIKCLNSKMYSKAIVFFAFLAMAVASNTVSNRFSDDTSDSTPIEARVVGGKPATKGQYPFIVSLQQTIGRQSRHFCAASILNERWVLSAAHCGKGIPASSITVKAGKNNLKVKEATEQTVKVLKVYIHEKYKGGVGPYDIALFKLATPLKMNKNVQTITLAQPNSIPTGNVWLCGWGSTSTSTFPIMPDKLQHVMLNIMNLKSCNQTIIKLTRSSSVDKTNICTGSPDRKSSCSGDSGGPLFKIINKKPVLVGIVSWGIIPCGSRGAPSVYTRVSNFNNWIAQKMRK
ncbi:TMPS9 protease, partial [Acromyrmex heyeri]